MSAMVFVCFMYLVLKKYANDVHTTKTKRPKYANQKNKYLDYLVVVPMLKKVESRELPALTKNFTDGPPGLFAIHR